MRRGSPLVCAVRGRGQAAEPWCQRPLAQLDKSGRFCLSGDTCWPGRSRADVRCVTSSPTRTVREYHPVRKVKVVFAGLSFAVRHDFSLAYKVVLSLVLVVVSAALSGGSTSW